MTLVSLIYSFILTSSAYNGIIIPHTISNLFKYRENGKLLGYALHFLVVIKCGLFFILLLYDNGNGLSVNVIFINVSAIEDVYVWRLFVFACDIVIHVTFMVLMPSQSHYTDTWLSRRLQTSNCLPQGIPISRIWDCLGRGF